MPLPTPTSPTSPYEISLSSPSILDFESVDADTEIAEDPSYDAAKEESVDTYISGLPIVEVFGVWDSKECMICQEPYGSVSGEGVEDEKDEKGHEEETATELPCKHIIGSTCLKRWFMNSEEKATCPMCRRVFHKLDNGGMLSPLPYLSPKSLLALRGS